MIVQSAKHYLKKDIEKIVEDNIRGIKEFCKRLMYGEIRLFDNH